MEIARLVVVHLLIGAVLVAMVAAWVVARWAATQFLHRLWYPSQPRRLQVHFPKMAPAKVFRAPVRDLLLQSAD